MTSDQAIEIAKEFGPLVLSAVGALLALLGSLAATIARSAWRSHRSQMSLMADALKKLAEAIADAEKENKGEHDKVRSTLQNLRAELQLSATKSEYLKAGMLSLEGALKSQVSRLDGYIEKLGQVHSKLDALFKFIDAPRRATDT